VVNVLETLFSRNVIKSQSGPIFHAKMLHWLQVLGDFVPQTPHRGFDPGHHWEISIPRLPILEPRLAKPAYVPADAV